MVIQGIYDRTLYRNEMTGLTQFTLYTCACVESRNSRGVLTCRGISPVYASGMPLKLEGEIHHTKMGDEFKFSSICAYSDKAETTVRYLTGGAFTGIGEKTAEKIVNITGPDIFSFVQQADAKTLLSKVLKEEVIDALFCTLKSTTRQKVVMDYIRPFGGDYIHAANITRQYPSDSINMLKRNCYKVGIDAGLPFFVCDSIAQSENYFVYDERRIEAIVSLALSTIMNSGHTCTDIDTLFSMVQRIAKNSAYAEPIPMGLIVRAANKEKSFTVDMSNGTNYYLYDMYRAERDLAKEANRIRNHSNELPYSETLINEIEASENVSYSEKQKEAFSFLKTTGIKILTGGPGTGKTTTINGLIRAYKKMNPDNEILLCAPTGRAAQKLFEATGIRAMTIHRALDVKPIGDEVRYKTLENPLDQKFIIVDEVSMADTTIISMLLGAVQTNSLVILCGDINQLPSVGPGSVLNDLIKTQRFETVTLDVIYRQAKGSSIVSNAITINKGSRFFVYDTHFQVITVKTEEEIQNKIVELTKEKYVPNDIFALQILSSTKKGAAGTTALNLSLQNICNPVSNHEHSSVVEYGTYKYNVGDKVMMTANNYKSKYFNGDIGVIRSIDSEKFCVEFNEEMIEVKRENLGDMTLALAVTIHKSQGSEYQTVIVALPANPSIMLQRNLLYTAVTRAKKNIIIVEQAGAISKAVRTLSNTERKTNLLALLNN